MLLKLPIKSGFSDELGTIEKEINENYLGTNYELKDFFEKNLVFFIKKSSFYEEANEIVATGEGKDVWSLLNELEFGQEEGINLEGLDISPKFFKDNLNEVEKLGFKVSLNEEYLNLWIRKEEHEKTRTKFQKLLGLNKFKIV